MYCERRYGARKETGENRRSQFPEEIMVERVDMK
jgi:hypothetical protein